MFNKSINSLVMFVFIFLIMNTNIVQAETHSNLSSRIEGVLVVDVSKSMLESDPNKISNEAMKMFVDMSSLKGDKIGVIAYANEVVSKKDIVKLGTDQDKNSLKNFIDSLEKFPNTDLSVGVKEAIKVLENSHEKEYRPLIVLLADGNNDLDKTKAKTNQQADEELNAAVTDAKAKGFPIYVIGLNANGDLNKDVLQNISTTTNGKFFETSNVDDLPRILSEIFADHSKLKILPANEQIGNGIFQDITLNIPNKNVFEANISLVSNQPVEVKLVDPFGKELPIPSKDILLTTSKSYSMLKLINPDQGNYTLKIKGFPQDKVDVNLILNYDLQLKFKTSQAGDMVKVAAFFEDSGEQISSKDLYNTMKSTLFVKDLDTAKTKEIQLNADSYGFSGEFALNGLMNYEMIVKAEGDSFYRVTEPKRITIQKVEKTAISEVSPSKKMQLSPSLNVIIVVAGVVLLISLVTALFVKRWREKKRGFNGQVLLEIMDDDTGEEKDSQCKEVKALKKEFCLGQLFSLPEEFSNTDQITFVPLTDHVLLLLNKSNCTIEMDGMEIEADSFHRFKRNSKLHIMSKELNKSIYLKIS
jgi:Ca-activated chloride channel homolog